MNQLLDIHPKGFYQHISPHDSITYGMIESTYIPLVTTDSPVQKITIPHLGDAVCYMVPVGVQNSIKKIDFVIEQKSVELARKALVQNGIAREIVPTHGVPIIDGLCYMFDVEYYTRNDLEIRYQQLHGVVIGYEYFSKRLDFSIQDVLEILQHKD